MSCKKIPYSTASVFLLLNAIVTCIHHTVKEVRKDLSGYPFFCSALIALNCTPVTIAAKKKINTKKTLFRCVKL